MDLAHLKNNPGAKHRTKRLGCGIGSGHGKTSGRGGKGQTARTGSSIRAGFEGGQMPLYRRLPKRGFNSFEQEVFAVVNVGSLNDFKAGETITPSLLKERGLLRSFDGGIKILGGGELKKKITVVANAFSDSAITKITSASGNCLVAKLEDARKDYMGLAKLDVAAAVQAKPHPAPQPKKAPEPKKPAPPKAEAKEVKAEKQSKQDGGKA